MNPQEAFLEMLLAAMKDAANGHLSQLKTTIAPDGKKTKLIRIVFLPEEMDHNWPTNQPLGTDHRQN